MFERDLISKKKQMAILQRFVAEEKVHVKRFENSLDHTHSLDKSDKVKRPQVIRNLVEQEAIKNYRPPAILNAVKEYTAETMDLNSSVKELKLKEVTNIKYKVRRTLDAHLIGSPGREKNIQKSIFFLEQKKYQVEHYMISNKFTHGFVFIYQKQIENLEKYGWLTLIDSTYKTNRYDYRLFTLYIRNRYSCWDVGAILARKIILGPRNCNEDSDTIAKALKIIRKFAPHWKPRYFFQDQNNVEANSIKLAFPGLRNGEQKCDTIFCTVHLLRTWMIPTIKQYIKRYYTKNNYQWALWAHQYSSLLLQVTSTNSLESYHFELKRTTSSQHGLIGAYHKVVILDQKKCTDSEYVDFEFRTKKISVIVCAVEKRLEKGKATLGLTSLYCNFDSWVKFQWMFEENGFEVYMHHELVEVDISEEIKAERAAENRRLAINELMEKIYMSSKLLN
ncbi:hypothetical protein Glove_230g147 [Diversispora epigaea]|uniref:ZSWIM1/3 RNaseH-like domain-containing protein n=1 Tax=Diversispora epigaea TaxID=1348612 RepID=A0A397ID75_9GLOM|nr:hypothetical protein Glove_230g147 [Diversispora epigaea]